MSSETGFFRRYKFILDRFPAEWNNYDILTTLYRLSFFYLRGMIQRLYFKRSSGWVLVGKGASIRYARHLSVGRDFIVEDYAEVNCMTYRGIIAGDRVTIGKHAIHILDVRVSLKLETM